MDDNPNEWGDGAATVLLQALRIDPDFAPASNNLGFVLKGKCDWCGAIYYYRNALRNDPQSAPAHANLAEISAGSGLVYDTIDHYQKALRIEPDFARAHYDLGLALEAKGYFDEANECYPEGVKTLDQFRGSALRQALEHYRQVCAFDPKWVPVPKMLQISAQNETRLNEAIGQFRQAIQADLPLARAYGALGQALLARQDFREAEAATKRGLDLPPPPGDDFRGNLEAQLQQCKRLIALEGRLAAIVQGKEKPASSEYLDLAELCFGKRHYAAAAPFYAQAFAEAPIERDLANAEDSRCLSAISLRG